MVKNVDALRECNWRTIISLLRTGAVASAAAAAAPRYSRNRWKASGQQKIVHSGAFLPQLKADFTLVAGAPNYGRPPPIGRQLVAVVPLQFAAHTPNYTTIQQQHIFSTATDFLYKV